MADDLNTLKTRLANLRQVRADLETIRKEAFMAAPPMPGAGGAPPQGGMPPGMDPAMMQQGGMPPGMDPAMMQQGMPPQGGGMPVDPNTGMPIDPNTGMPMDPNAMGGQPQAPPSPLTPEMVEELIGVIEELTAGSEQHEKAIQQMAQQQEDLAGRFEELEQRLAQLFSAPQPGGM